MSNTRIAKRVVQTVLVAMLGLGPNTQPMQAQGYCPSRECTGCPAQWHGSCYTGIQGCQIYDCEDDGYCFKSGDPTEYQQCYCAPCN